MPSTGWGSHWSWSYLFHCSCCLTIGQLIVLVMQCSLSTDMQELKLTTSAHGEIQSLLRASSSSILQSQSPCMWYVVTPVWAVIPTYEMKQELWNIMINIYIFVINNEGSINTNFKCEQDTNQRCQVSLKSCD